MAQTGYTPILIYASGTTGNTPSAANLTSSASGAELALNYFDGKLFYKDASGNVQVLAGKGGTGVVAGSNTQIQFNNNGVFGASANLTWDGSFLTVASIKDSALTSGRVTYAGASGLLQDSANMTFNGTTLSIAGLNNTGNTTLGTNTANTLTLNALVSSNMLFTDNSYDIGANGANRPKSMYLTSTVYAGAAVYAGTTTFANNGRNNQRVLSVNATADYGGMAMTSYCGTTQTIGPILDFNRSRGTTDQSFTSVANGDALGFINFRGASGAGFTDAAQIVSYAGGVVSSGVVPGLLQFSTSSTTTGLVTRYQISATGTHTWTNVGGDSSGTALTLGSTGLGITNGLTVGTTSTFTGSATFNSGVTYFGNTSNNDLVTTTSAGSDISSIRISGGGAIGVGRGALLQAFGNQHPSYPGQVYVDQGNVTGAMTYFRYGNINVGAQMDGSGNWTFSQAVGINSTPNASQARLIVTPTVGSAAIRVRNGTDVGYRADWATDPTGVTTINSYYDTTLTYKPFKVDASELRFSVNGTSGLRAYFDGNGLRVSSSESYSSLISNNLFFGQRADIGTNAAVNVMRLTDSTNADFNVFLRSGNPIGVARGTMEVQTAAYNMWLSTSQTTGALKITDTVNNGNGGQVTKPYSACFSAGLSGTGGQFSYTANADLVFANEVVDAGSNYNPSNGRFTAPVAGNYWMAVHVRWENTNSSNAYFSVTLAVNGSNIQRSIGDLVYVPASQYNYSFVGIVVNLAAGDYVTAGTRQNSGTTFATTPNECSFDGFLIG